MGNPFSSIKRKNHLKSEASHTPKQWTEVGRLKSKKGCNRKAVAQCIAGHPRSDATAGRCPPTGGTLPARANNFSKIEARQRNIFAKKRKNKFFSKNEARMRKFFARIKIN
jgi:hypothetical protein